MIKSLSIEWKTCVSPRCEKRLIEVAICSLILDFMGGVENATIYYDEFLKHNRPIGDHWDRLTKAAIYSYLSDNYDSIELVNIKFSDFIITPEFTE